MSRAVATLRNGRIRDVGILEWREEKEWEVTVGGGDVCRACSPVSRYLTNHVKLNCFYNLVMNGVLRTHLEAVALFSDRSELFRRW
ncbi:hypothetical protein NDU88_011105 [Pleurodeles waltl]|uniref:Uncharacterized protein n=1 Tax=Pleurodeles waltl TaxID=8319 RepID=A0AAV7S2Z2_PLEWA|nr:hypothetical protein NDU88_011105 [Pleurodeles waltl]